MTRTIASLLSWYGFFRSFGLSIEDAFVATVEMINHSNWLLNSIHWIWVGINPTLAYMLHISSSLIPMLLILSLTLAIALRQGWIK